MMDILKLAGTYEFVFTTHDPTTGELVDVDGDSFTTVTYENAVDGSMYSPAITQVKDEHAADVTGTYRCVVVATGANGFETGKRYNVVATYAIGGVTQSAPVATFKLLTYDMDDIMAMIGTAVALDGGSATIAGMLTKMADDNGGASFNAEFDSLNKISDALDVVDGNVDDIETLLNTVDGKIDTIDGNVDDIETLLGAVDGKIDTIDGNVDDIETAIGTPVVLDHHLASIAGMLTAMADNNNGTDFACATDSLHEQSNQLATIDGNVDDIETLAGSIDGKVDNIYIDTQRVDGLIEDDGHGADRFTAKALEEAPSSGGGTTAQEVWEYVVTGLEPAGSSGDIIADTLANIGAPVALDGGTATLAGMLTKMADDNNGADFNSEFDSLNKISNALNVVDGNVDDIETLLGTVDGKIDTISGNVDDIETAIGTPVALDGGAATLGGMLTKIADDNGGADYDATTDSLHKISGAVGDVYTDTQRVDGLIEDDGHGLDRFTAKALEEAPTGATASEVWEYTPTGLEPANSTAEKLTEAHANIGTPVALDGGAATVGGMLVKIADDNAGGDFDATTDSLHEIAAAISGSTITVDDIWNESLTTHLTPGTTGNAVSRTLFHPEPIFSKTAAETLIITLDRTQRLMIKNAPPTSQIKIEVKDKNGMKITNMAYFDAGRKTVHISGGSITNSPFTITLIIDAIDPAYDWEKIIGTLIVETL